jgi:hypothetical protein
VAVSKIVSYSKRRRGRFVNSFLTAVFALKTEEDLI